MPDSSDEYTSDLPEDDFPQSDSRAAIGLPSYYDPSDDLLGPELEFGFESSDESIIDIPDPFESPEKDELQKLFDSDSLIEDAVEQYFLAGPERGNALTMMANGRSEAAAKKQQLKQLLFTRFSKHPDKISAILELSQIQEYLNELLYDYELLSNDIQKLTQEVSPEIIFEHDDIAHTGPTKVFYHDVSHGKAAEKLVGYFKPGIYRHAVSRFLCQLEDTFRALNAIPAIVERIFVPSHPFQVDISAIRVPGNASLDSINDMEVELPLANGQCVNKIISIKDNADEAQRVLLGELQPALQPWQFNFKDDDSRLGILYMLFFIMLLNGEDMKADGVCNNNTIVDMEHILEPVDKGKPKLHVPLLGKFHDQCFKQEDFARMLAGLNDFDVGQLIERIDGFNYYLTEEIQFDEHDRVVDQGNCVASLDCDAFKVSEKLVRQRKAMVITDDQLDMLRDNFEKLATIVQDLTKVERIKAIDLVGLFDPCYKKSLEHAEAELSSNSDPLSSSYSRSTTPFDIAGWRSASPVSIGSTPMSSPRSRRMTSSSPALIADSARLRLMAPPRLDGMGECSDHNHRIFLLNSN